MFINAAIQFPNPHDPVNKAARRHAQNLEAAVQTLASAGGAPDPRSLSNQVAMLIMAAIMTRHAKGDLNAAAVARTMAAAILDRELRPTGG